jgi:hypothetical protein
MKYWSIFMKLQYHMLHHQSSKLDRAHVYGSIHCPVLQWQATHGGCYTKAPLHKVRRHGQTNEWSSIVSSSTDQHCTLLPEGMTVRRHWSLTELVATSCIFPVPRGYQYLSTGGPKFTRNITLLNVLKIQHDHALVNYLNDVWILIQRKTRLNMGNHITFIVLLM